MTNNIHIDPLFQGLSTRDLPNPPDHLGEVLQSGSSQQAFKVKLLNCFIGFYNTFNGCNSFFTVVLKLIKLKKTNKKHG